MDKNAKKSKRDKKDGMKIIAVPGLQNASSVSIKSLDDENYTVPGKQI